MSFCVFAFALAFSCLSAFLLPTSATSPYDAPKNWKKIDLGNFSFYLPPDMKDQHARGIDSAVWQFRNREMTLGLDYRMYSYDLQFYANKPEYYAEWTQIGGKRARFATFRMNKADSGEKDRTYLTAVYFPEA